MMPSQSSNSEGKGCRSMLPILTDELLIDAYRSALRLRLEREFVHMLRAEIRRRNLTVPGERVC